MVTSLCHFAHVACMTLLLRHNLFMLNMAETENNVEQRNAVRFMFGEGESASNVYIRLQKVYGEHCMNRAQVFDGLSELKLEEQASTTHHAVADHQRQLMNRLLRKLTNLFVVIVDNV